MTNMVELLEDDFWGGRPNDIVCGVCSPGYPFPTAPPVDPFARIKVVDCGVTKGCIRSVCVYVFCLLASMCVCQGVSLYCGPTLAEVTFLHCVCRYGKPGCDAETCDYFMSYRRIGTDVEYEMSADTDGWVAVGFSSDKKMVRDRICVCAGIGVCVCMSMREICSYTLNLLPTIE